jgi:hypothetical protein
MATDNYIPNAITVRELAESMDQAHTPNDAFIDFFLRPHGHVVGVDWRGRPAVSEATAFRVREGHYEAARIEQEKRAAYAEYVGQRNLERDRQAMEAHDRAFLDHVAVKKDRRAFGLPIMPRGKTTVGAGLTTIDPDAAFERAQEDAEGREAARDARREALKRFDERQPEMSYEQWVKRQKKVKVTENV